MQNISVDEAKVVLDTKDGTVFLDVRTPGEYSRGKIEKSINIPVDQVADTVLAAIPDKSRKIIAYCLSGSRSDMAAVMLEQLGYTNVFSMTHGLLEWRAKKYPLAV